MKIQTITDVIKFVNNYWETSALAEVLGYRNAEEFKEDMEKQGDSHCPQNPEGNATSTGDYE